MRASFRAPAAALLAAASLTGCYVYTPVALRPVPGMQLAFDLNDHGRIALSGRLGPEVARVEGQLAESTDSTYTILMSRVRSIDGTVNRWTGENVTLRREHVKDVSERRLSRGRTAVTAGGFAVALAAIILGADLAGGGNDDGGDGGPRPPDEQ